MLEINKIRTRLTILNSTVVLAILIAITAFILIVVGVNNDNTIDNELVTSAYTLKRYISVVDYNLPEVSQESIDEYHQYQQRLLSSYIAYGIYGSGEQTFATSSIYDMPEETLSGLRMEPFYQENSAIKVLSEADGIYYIHSCNVDGQNYRVCTTVASSDDGALRIIQTLYNLSISNSVISQLRKTMILAVILGFLISIATGYLIAGRSIKPIKDSMDRQSQFIADASHELRTPVTIMKTNLDVVMEEPDSTVAEQMEWIDSAYKETGHMQNLISDLLETVKSDLGQLVSEKKPVDMDELCRENISRFRRLARNKDIALTYIPDDMERCIVKGDRSKLFEVLEIITDNAIRYTPSGKNITLELIRDGDRVRIALTDEGIGMKKEDTEKIFDRFYRVDKARSRAQGGSGLGLSIAKDIVEAHNGRIYAESRIDEGTTVTVILPAAEV